MFILNRIKILTSFMLCLLFIACSTFIQRGQEPYEVSSYILKDNCDFVLVYEGSPIKVKGPNAVIKVNEVEIVIENCSIIKNSHDLPVYESTYIQKQRPSDKLK